MGVLLFDTLKLADALQQADFSEVQAKGLVAALAENAQDTLATKEDIAGLKTDLYLETGALKLAIGALKVEIGALKTDIATLRSDVKADIAALRVDTAKWVIGAVAFNFLATAGLFATLFKLFAK